MRREKQLIKNTLVISLGQFLSQFFNVILIPLITGRLSKIEYGNYDFILTVVAFLLPIATLQIHSAAFRFLIDARGDNKTSQRIVTNICLFTTLTSTIVIFIISIVWHQFSIYIRLLLALYLYFDIFNVMLGQVARGLDNNKAFSFASVILSACKTLFIVIALAIFDLGLSGIILAIVLSYGVANIYLFTIIGINKYISLDEISIVEIKKLISYSLPMVPNNMSSWVLNVSDRLIITIFLGVEANAIYAAANNIPNILNVARGVIVMAWQEGASIAVNDEDAPAYFSKSFSKMFSLAAGITACVIGLMPALFAVLIKGGYNEAYVQMPILLIGVFYGCMSAFQGGIYIAHMKTKSVGITTMIAAIINIVVDLMLIKTIGVFAGSISTLVSYLFLFTYRLIDVRSFQKITYSYKQIIGYSLFLIVMCSLAMCRMPLVYIFNAVASLVFAYVINRELIASIVSMGINAIYNKRVG